MSVAAFDGNLLQAYTARMAEMNNSIVPVVPPHDDLSKNGKN